MWRQTVGPESSQSQAETAASPQAVAGPDRETHGGWTRDRDMDRHDMQSEVEYLFRGLWRGKGEGGRERERERERL